MYKDRLPNYPLTLNVFDRRASPRSIGAAEAHANAKRFHAWLEASGRSMPNWGESVAGQTEATYPGGSKSRVNKAGAAVRANTATADDLACIDTWRAAHQPVINTFQAMLRSRAKAAGAVVGQRHKRKITIFNKLERLPKMDLARMDDIAGCRLIFEDTERLYTFRKKLHSAKFHHSLRNALDKYDYIKVPKSTGYRGIHDIYEYNVLNEKTSKSNGLFVELQYRTSVQHAWATTNEIIGFVTESQPKFQKGDLRYQDIMKTTSEILARSFEDSNSCFPEYKNKELVEKFLELDSELGFMNLLGGLNSSSAATSKATNIILMMKDGKPLEIKTYRYAPEALRSLFRLEAENPGVDVVFVKGNTSEDVRIAFRNYFTDAREFIRLVESGCEKLSGKNILRARGVTKPAKGSTR